MFRRSFLMFAALPLIPRAVFAAGSSPLADAFAALDTDARRIALVEMQIAALYAPRAQSRCDLDGLSLDFGTWRMNLRASNTEPLLRLNVEARGRPDLVDQAVQEISALIVAGPAQT